MAGVATTPRNMPRLLKASYLADSEALLRETRATGLFYFPGPILAILLFGILLYASATAVTSALPSIANVTSHLTGTYAKDVLLVFLILFLLAVLWLLVRYIRWISTIYAVTTTRVIVQSGILGRDFDEIPIPQVRGVDVHQTAGQRLLGYGTVRVSSEGGSRLGNEDWRGIPRPFEFQRLIENASQAPGAVGRRT